jgi:hypothetical protein
MIAYYHKLCKKLKISKNTTIYDSYIIDNIKIIILIKKISHYLVDIIGLRNKGRRAARIYNGRSV